MVDRFKLEVDEKRVLWVLGSLLSRSRELSVDFQTLLNALQSQLLDEGVLSAPEELRERLSGWLRTLEDKQWVENRDDGIWQLSHGGWTIWGGWRPPARPER